MTRENIRYGNENEGRYPTKWDVCDLMSSEYSKEVIGNKIANTQTLIKLSYPVPEGFIVIPSTQQIHSQFETDLDNHLRSIEDKTQKKFGSEDNPLFLAARSSPTYSMPGMMDTILNIGATPQTIESFASNIGKHPAYDMYRRFLYQFGTTALGFEPDEFKSISMALKREAQVANTSQLSVGYMEDLISQYRELIELKVPLNQLDDPWWQLTTSIMTVYKSLFQSRVKNYKLYEPSKNTLNTGILIQEMKFGLGPNSATGVVFSRNINNGEHHIYGEYLDNAQGPDIVDGIKTPLNLLDLRYSKPQIFQEIKNTSIELEKHIKDVTDIEFTIENGEFYVLQLRPAKKTPLAHVRILRDMVHEGLISQDEALSRISREQLQQAQARRFSEEEKAKAITEGRLMDTAIPVSVGVSVGKALIGRGTAMSNSILILRNTTPDDFDNIRICSGIITQEGGTTSHAALSARALNKPAILGAHMRSSYGEVVIGKHRINSGDTISIDGNTGQIFIGEIPIISPQAEPAIEEVNSWFYTDILTKVDLDVLERYYDLRKMINDFYISSFLLQQDSLLSSNDLSSFHYRKAKELADMFTGYLLNSLTSELQYFAIENSINKDMFSYGEIDYLVNLGVFSDEKAENILHKLRSQGSEALMEFIEIASTVFQQGMFIDDNESRTFGGLAWYNITKTVYDYLNDPNFSPTLFVDRAFDLRHNDRVMLDKRPEMIDPLIENDVKKLLDIKRNARSIDEIKKMLEVCSSISPELIDYLRN